MITKEEKYKQYEKIIKKYVDWKSAGSRIILPKDRIRIEEELSHIFEKEDEGSGLAKEFYEKLPEEIKGESRESVVFGNFVSQILVELY